MRPLLPGEGAAVFIRGIGLWGDKGIRKRGIGRPSRPARARPAVGRASGIRSEVVASPQEPEEWAAPPLAMPRQSTGLGCVPTRPWYSVNAAGVSASVAARRRALNAGTFYFVDCTLGSASRGKAHETSDRFDCRGLHLFAGLRWPRPNGGPGSGWIRLLCTDGFQSAPRARATLCRLASPDLPSPSTDGYLIRFEGWTRRDSAQHR